MRICNIYIMSIFLFFYSFVFAPNINFKKINLIAQSFSFTPKACDCNDAITLNLEKSTTYNLVKSSNGYGAIQEIKSKNSNDKFAFEEEHNTTWYLLNINYDGEFVFEITPEDSTNDYDFLLYKFNDSLFCNALLNKKILPVRSNLSRKNTQLRGRTGLSVNAKSDFVGKGISEAYSKSIQVKSGEKYMLVLDNVYPNGKTHKINFNYIKKIDINGSVTNFAKQPIEAEISLVDKNNNIIEKVVANSKTGNYKISTAIKETDDYSLIFYNSSYFPEVEFINTENMESEHSILTVNKTLSGLKLGEIYNLVYFNPQQMVFLLSIEEAPIRALYYIMQKNSKMKIQIQGHSNKYELTKNEKMTNGGLKTDQELSVERADYVYFRLEKMGVSKDRMKKIGLGSSKMLIPNPKTEEEKNKNMRVSIKILALN
jgi:OmpA family